MVWCEGMEGWKQATEVEELSELFKGVPPVFFATSSTQEATPPLPISKTKEPEIPKDEEPFIRKHRNVIIIISLLLIITIIEVVVNNNQAAKQEKLEKN